MTIKDVLKLINNHAAKKGIHNIAYLRDLEDGLMMPPRYMGAAVINYIIDLYEEKESLRYQLYEKNEKLGKLEEELKNMVNGRDAQMIKVKTGTANINPNKK